MRLVDIKNLVPLTELCFPEHCNTTMRAARSAASCPVATTEMANSKFHYFSSLLVYYPEYCQIITEHAACVAWKHIPNTKGKYYISKSRVQTKQGAQCNCLVQGNGSFHDAALKRGSLTHLHKVGLSNQAIGLFPSCFERCKRGRHKRKARRIYIFKVIGILKILFLFSVHPRSSYNWIQNPVNVIFVSGAAKELYCKFALIHPCEGPIWQIIHLVHCTLSGMAWIPYMINRFLLRSVSFNPQQGQNYGCLANKLHGTHSSSL